MRRREFRARLGLVAGLALLASSGCKRSELLCPNDGGICVGDGGGRATAPWELRVGAGGHVCVRDDRDEGRARCWGANAAGQLGAGDQVARTVPVRVAGLTQLRSLALGAAHTCASRSDGTALCWGAGDRGQLGTGAATAMLLPPTPVLGLADVAEVAAYGATSCARFGSGAVTCWGENSRGQLGDGALPAARPFRPTPMPVVGLADVRGIAVGGEVACARRAEGTVACWGRGGLVGDGTTADRTVPVAVAGVGDVAEIAAGASSVCARRAGGTVVCWGENARGQLGDGTTTARALPTPVVGLADAVQIAVGDGFACARRAGGTVVCWGGNARGQLGDGTQADRTLPSSVAGLLDATELAAGVSACARRASGVVVCWGPNEQGQLGDGTRVDRLSPVVVAGL